MAWKQQMRICFHFYCLIMLQEISQENCKYTHVGIYFNLQE